jgi:TetR/AcrR family transcriptional regulator, mexJK operon transcriptional repressor
MDATVNPATRLGRPKDPGKRAAIIAAAEILFMQHGYDEVTMDAVAAAASVSKMTVYGHFHDKAALFAATVRVCADRMTKGLEGLAEGHGARDLEQGLVAFGTALMELLLSPRMAVMSHVLIGTLMKNPALAAAFHEAGPGHTRSVLARAIAAAAARGELVVDSAQDAADDLLSLWQGELPKRLALGLEPPMTPERIAARVRRGTAVFLRAYAARPHRHAG